MRCRTVKNGMSIVGTEVVKDEKSSFLLRLGAVGPRPNWTERVEFSNKHPHPDVENDRIFEANILSFEMKVGEKGEKKTLCFFVRPTIDEIRIDRRMIVHVPTFMECRVVQGAKLGGSVDTRSEGTRGSRILATGRRGPWEDALVEIAPGGAFKITQQIPEITQFAVMNPARTPGNDWPELRVMPWAAWEAQEAARKAEEKASAELRGRLGKSVDKFGQAVENLEKALPPKPKSPEKPADKPQPKDAMLDKVSGSPPDGDRTIDGDEVAE